MGGQPATRPDEQAPGKGSWVTVTGPHALTGRSGHVVGPDRQFTPQPRAVFVQFDVGPTRLIDVVDLIADTAKRPPATP